MLNPMIIRSDNGQLVPLSDVAVTGDIAANPTNIASLCICIAELSKERQLWLEPSEAMVLSGMAQLQAYLLEVAVGEDIDIFGHIDPEHMTDSQLSDAVVFVLQSMASKR